MTFLQKAKSILKDSDNETKEILADKKLMKSIKKSEKEFDGGGEDWEEVKKELFK